MKKKDDSDSDDEEMQRYKVIFVGESGVGKTCIIYRYCEGIFKDNSTPSLSASYGEKIIELEKYGGKEIKFGIWDTAGQEQYRSLTKNYFQNASAAILVYDITNKSSFEEINKYWYNRVIECCPQGTIKYLFYFNY